jgi:hypothetical protein
MKRTFLIVPAILLLAIGCNKQTNPPVESFSNSPKNESADTSKMEEARDLTSEEWKKYQNDYNFSIEIPANWKVHEVAEGNSKGVTISSPDDSLDSVEIFPMGRENYGYAASYEVNKEFLTKTKFGGKDAEQYITTSYWVIHIFNPPAGWGAHPANMISGNYQDHKDIVDSILKSFKFTK